MKKWLYGDKWEKFPIEEEDVWTAGDNRIMCADILRHDIYKLFGTKRFDMSYTDPPWNTGNINSFRTKAGMTNRDDFYNFISVVLATLKLISPKVNFIEMGKQNLDLVLREIKLKAGTVTDCWNTTYYNRNPCYLIRFTFEPLNIVPFPVSLNGKDDNDTPALAIEHEPSKPKNVVDLCAGKGLTGRAAFFAGLTFYGTELNKRRLAWLLEFYTDNNIPVKRLED